VRPLAQQIDRLEFNSITGVAIAVAYWRRRSPGRKRGRPGGTTAPCHGGPYEDWKMSKVQCPLRGPLDSAALLSTDRCSLRGPRHSPAISSTEVSQFFHKVDGTWEACGRAQTRNSFRG